MLVECSDMYCTVCDSLQERGGANAFNHDALTLKFKMDNEFELIFVVSRHLHCLQHTHGLFCYIRIHHLYHPTLLSQHVHMHTPPLLSFQHTHTHSPRWCTKRFCSCPTWINSWTKCTWRSEIATKTSSLSGHTVP